MDAGSSLSDRPVTNIRDARREIQERSDFGIDHATVGYSNVIRGRSGLISFEPRSEEKAQSDYFRRVPESRYRNDEDRRREVKLSSRSSTCHR